MSDKQFEECSLEEATHVELDSKVHELGDGNVEKIEGGLNVHMKHWDNYLSIFASAFTTFGIKPMRERKREPIEFEAIVKASMASYFFLGNVPEGVPLGTKFKCVEILEEEK